MSFDAEGDALFQALRAERKSIADEQGVPAFVVLHDATLRELARLRPRNHAGLLVVSGIGVTKAERYGERLLATIARYL
jgi:ATP-dependent DNA helicase RecQ